MALCSTLDGIEFTLVFDGGNDYVFMCDAIGMGELQSEMTPRTWQEAARDRHDAASAYYAEIRGMSFDELMAWYRQQGLVEGYHAARERNLHLEYLRSLDVGQLSYLSQGVRSIGVGKFEHCGAFYYRFHDVFLALCTTNDGTDFNLVFRDGPAYAHMVTAVKPEGLRQQ